MKKTKLTSKKGKKKQKLMPNKHLLVAFFVVLLFGAAIIIRNNMNHRLALDTISAIAQNDSDELKDIKQKIKEKKAKWDAEETSILKLSPEERKKRVMQKLEKPANLKKISVPAAPTTVTNLDWRNGGGSGGYSGAYVTPVKDQGSCGSCWDFAATATAESAILLKNNTSYTNNPIDLSEQVMLSCSGAGTCNGGIVQNAANFLQSTGLPAEACYPYTGTNGNCSAACSNWQASTSKIVDNKYVTTTNSDVSIIRSAVLTYGPVATTMAVYNDFFAYKSGVYSYTTGALAGYHAVEIVGFDDTAQAFIVKNSWGANWGEGGFFKIAYSEAGGKSQFGQYTVAYNTTTPLNLPESDSSIPVASIIAPTEGATVSNWMLLKVSATDAVGISKVEYYVDDKLQFALSSAADFGQWNTTLFPNGPHYIYVKAYDPAGNVGKSQTVNINISNGVVPPPVPDTTPPTVTITAPKDGSTVSGNVTISAKATDNIGVTGMEIYVNNNKMASSATGSISWVWGTRFIAKQFYNIPYDIMVKAKDAAGNSVSKSISVILGKGSTGKR